MASTAQKLGAEFLGTYLLILTVGCNVLGGSGMNAGLSIAAVLMVSIYAMGSVSGACFNPAVTLAVFLTKRNAEKNPFTATDLLTYWAAQLIGGAAAGLTFVSVYGDSINIGPQAKASPATGSYGWLDAMTVELLYTWLLCFVVLRCAVDAPVVQEYFGLCIGFVIVAGAYAAGPVSGGCFNPAVAFGLDLSSADKGFHGCIWYSLAELAGAALAAGVHGYFQSAPKDSDGEHAPLTKFVSEFLGTFVLVLTVGLNVLTMSPAGALSIAASLMVMIYACADVSGSHFNPAVTLSLALSNAEKWSMVPVYIGAQLVGGLVAGLTYSGVVGLAFPLSPGKGYNWLDVAVAEVLFTFVLCFVVLNCAASSGGKLNQMYGLAIAFTIVAGGNAIGMVSGGSLNPAVSFGIDSAYAMKGGAFLNCLAYAGFEVIGASLAAIACKVVRPGEVGK